MITENATVQLEGDMLLALVGPKAILGGRGQWFTFSIESHLHIEGTAEEKSICLGFLKCVMTHSLSLNEGVRAHESLPHVPTSAIRTGMGEGRRGGGWVKRGKDWP